MPQTALPDAPQSPDAQLKVGDQYAYGQGVQRNDVEAVRWYRMAAEGGNAEAQYKLGVMLDKVWGTRRDSQEAVKWFTTAANQGHVGGMNNMGLMYEKGRGVPQNTNEAIRWYQMAADRNEPIAMYNLGLIYERGFGVPKDMGKAMEYFQKADSLGLPEARKKMNGLVDYTVAAFESDYRNAKNTSQLRNYGRSGGSGDRPPSEDEMCGAIRDKFAAINQNLSQTKQLCEQRAFRNDPFLTMQCMVQYGASGGSGNLSARLTRCEQKACEKAAGQPGYVCDYIVGFSMPTPAMPRSVDAYTSNGDYGQGRFVNTNDGWLFIPMNQ
jgi:hypothetical protein